MLLVEGVAFRIAGRHVSTAEETTGSLATAAARHALDASSSRSAPDLLVCATFTPDRLLCPTAPAVASALGLRGTGAFDVNAACSGAVLGLLTALGFLSAGVSRKVLLVCSDTTTKYLRPYDEQTRILFGDGAAALLLESANGGGSRLRAWLTGSDGWGAALFSVPEGGSRRPFTCVSPDGPPPAVKMQGRPLFRFAVDKGEEIIRARGFRRWADLGRPPHRGLRPPATVKGGWGR